jgi:F0F1-type ATP synthase assembly protein I
VGSAGNEPEKGSGNRRWSREFGPFLTLGIQLALTVVIFFFVGRWLDEKLDTAPWLMLAGLLAGIAGGMIKFFRTVSGLDGDTPKR